MSGPNTNYDPVEVTPLHADEIARIQTEALEAFAGAADLAALTEAKQQHLGDRSPVALANREIGALPPQARKEAGQRVGARPQDAHRGVRDAARGARGRARAADAGRGAGRRDAALAHPAARCPAPAVSLISEQIADVFTALGWDVDEGPEVGGRVAELRRAELPARPPGAADAGHLLRRPAGVGGGAAHAHLAGAGPHDADPRAADLRDLPGPGLPHRRAGRDALAGVHAGRGPGRGRGHLAGAPEGHPGPLRRTDVRRGSGVAAAAELLPVHRAVRRGGPEVLRLPRRVRRQPGPAVPDLLPARAGSSGAAAAW